MASAKGWITRYPGVLVLVVAIILGQLLEKLAQPRLNDPPLLGQVPVVTAIALAIAVALALVILVVRIRLGEQVVGAARQRAFRLPEPASLPRQYAVSDPAGQVTSGALGLLDLALLLLVQNTLRAPLLVLTERFGVDRARADVAFVVVVVLLAVLLLVKVYRSGGPVLVVLLWWALDRVVPTAGFLGSRAEVATARTTTSKALTAPPTPAPAPTAVRAGAQEAATLAAPAAPVEEVPTVAAPAPVEAPTLAAPVAPEEEPTLAAPVAPEEEAPTLAAPAPPEEEAPTLAAPAPADPPTVVRRQVDDDATVRRPDSP